MILLLFPGFFDDLCLFLMIFPIPTALLVARKWTLDAPWMAAGMGMVRKPVFIISILIDWSLW